jgi:adenylosuccinate synthase
MLRNIGEEYGATTGRPRQCNWLDLDALNRSVNINGVTHMVLNKIDVLEKVNRWSLKHKGEIQNFNSRQDMCNYIIENTSFRSNSENVYFSGNKHSLE